MNVIFRSDASNIIGSGHVMRCLTLATALKGKGAHCSFICRNHNGNMINLIKKNGFPVITLPLHKTHEKYAPSTNRRSTLEHANWLGVDWATDAKECYDAVSSENLDLLIVDHYALDFRWESVFRPKFRKIMVIDDLADRRHDCDVLLDQNLVSEMKIRYNHKVPQKCIKFLGPKYALIQTDYAKIREVSMIRKNKIYRIFVYFGGVDTSNLTGMTLKVINSLDINDVEVDIVANEQNPNLNELKKQVKNQEKVHLHVGLKSLAPLMSQADLAIGAGGATSWERCCLGLPSIVISIAKNQTPIAEELHKQGLICWLGYKTDINEEMLKAELKKLIETGIPQDWSKKCSHLVDGLGVERVARFLSETNYNNSIFS